MDQEIQKGFVLPGGRLGNPTKSPKKAARANDVDTSEVSVLREPPNPGNLECF